MTEKMPAGKFKAECLQVMEKVRKTRRRITITKRNVPIAQLGPIDEKEEKSFGKLKGSVHFLDNIIDPIDEVWNADH
ncbi:hypothetical protein LCGC14_0942610 [marine sediment metagenome]|uniref:Antitoxin n=1 Tax=marine sediment metagenome TaxID=412755 RepID=A0A0F9R3A3_9ZZZZ